MGDINLPRENSILSFDVEMLLTTITGMDLGGGMKPSIYMRIWSFKSHARKEEY
jgi:hypothetical protein